MLILNGENEIMLYSAKSKEFFKINDKKFKNAIEVNKCCYYVTDENNNSYLLYDNQDEDIFGGKDKVFTIEKTYHIENAKNVCMCNSSLLACYERGQYKFFILDDNGNLWMSEYVCKKLKLDNKIENIFNNLVSIKLMDCGNDKIKYSQMKIYSNNINHLSLLYIDANQNLCVLKFLFDREPIYKTIVDSNNVINFVLDEKFLFVLTHCGVYAFDMYTFNTVERSESKLHLVPNNMIYEGNPKSFCATYIGGSILSFILNEKGEFFVNSESGVLKPTLNYKNIIFENSLFFGVKCEKFWITYKKFPFWKNFIFILSQDGFIYHKILEDCDTLDSLYIDFEKKFIKSDVGEGSAFENFKVFKFLNIKSAYSSKF